MSDNLDSVIRRVQKLLDFIYSSPPDEDPANFECIRTIPFIGWPRF